ncbi:restriction endonuclease subunit S [Chryseobacterium wangxinyae]|uniref:restriction endonuclease subunit S n=1 Tax=Chryseobacterium sp. CY353 TaxID=2997334 RepID=UPI0022713697|nr:restriction endonuclease subunit S [Chryseobacterium sp. CY353]MCY0971035.1 restriction endonuclease subunit S [Chryseobacterium sp. CY353]
MKDNLPKGWSSKNINEVSTLIRGLTYKPEQVKSKNNGIACFRTKNIQSKLDESDIVYIDESILKSNDKYLQFGDVLVSSANSLELLGKCCLIKDLGYKATLGGFICAFRPDKKIIDYKYFYYYFGSVKFQEIIRNYANKTTGIANLPVKKVEQTPIHLPNLLEQKLIVSVLDKTLEKIDQTIILVEENIQKLKNLNKSILNDIFDQLKLYKVEKFEDINKSSQIGLVKNSKEQDIEFEYSYFKMNNINIDGSHNTIFTKVNATSNEVEKFSLKDGDLLFNTRNSRELVGKTCIFKSSKPNILYNNNILRVRFTQNVIGDFINYQFLSDFIKVQIETIKSGTTSVSAIYYKNLSNIKIKIPTISEQKSIVNYLDQTTEKNNQLTKYYKDKLEALKQLKNSILDRAFKGELRREKAIPVIQPTVDPFFERTKSWNSKKNADKQAMIIALAIEAHEKLGKSLYRTKGEKTVEIIEKHINLDFGREAKKMAAGPAAFEHLVKVVEPLAKEKKWFTVQDIKGENFDSHKYIKEENFNPFLMRSVQDLKSNLPEIRRVIGLFVTMKTTHEAEVISTTYTGWNNLIIRNEQIVDEAIVSEARENWHNSKLKIERQEFFNAIEWLRKNNLIPKGNGKEVL